MNNSRLKNNHTSRLFFLFFLLVAMHFSLTAQKKNKNSKGNAADNRLTRGFGGGSINTNSQLGTIVLYTHNDQGKTTFTVTNNETKQAWTGQDSVYLSDTTAKPDCSWGRVLKFYVPAGDYDVVTENDCGWGKKWNNPRHVNAGECKILNYSGCYHKPQATTTATTNSNTNVNTTANKISTNNVNNNNSTSNTNTTSYESLVEPRKEDAKSQKDESWKNDETTLCSPDPNVPITQPKNCLSLEQIIAAEKELQPNPQIKYIGRIKIVEYPVRYKDNDGIVKQSLHSFWLTGNDICYKETIEQPIILDGENKWTGLLDELTDSRRNGVEISHNCWQYPNGTICHLSKIFKEGIDYCILTNFFPRCQY